jgi:regulator of cell morphogenesis and NO signaling
VAPDRRTPAGAGENMSLDTHQSPIGALTLGWVIGGRSMMVITEADIAAQDSYAVEVELEISVARPSPRPQSPEALIAFILDRFHETHRRELPQLIDLARKVETVHADHPGCPAGLADFLTVMAEELEAHMGKEEQILFPTLLSGGAACTPFALRRMRLEHADHDLRLQELKAGANAFQPPSDACGSWRKLYAGCEKLYNDLRAHIDTENNVLFPMFE